MKLRKGQEVQTARGRGVITALRYDGLAVVRLDTGEVVAFAAESLEPVEK